MRTELDYISGASILPEGAFGISPSNVNNFFTSPSQWYREQVLGEDGFTGSTSSVLGTIVHYCAESFAKKQTVNINEIYNYIYKECVLTKDLSPKFEDTLPEEEKIEFLRMAGNNPEIDVHRILDQWKIMGQTLINYLSENGLPYRSEELIKAEIIPGYWVSGSADAVKGSDVSAVLEDYKTTGKLTADTTIPSYYKYQLLTYAYIYNQMGVNVDRIRIIWITNNVVGRVSEKTGKPMKDYPCTVTAVTEPITQGDLNFIKSILTLVAESVRAVKETPSLTHLIFKDMRLKTN